jgi:hypothetical protein
VLVLLVLAGWLAVLFCTLSMCRAGARTDEAQDRVLSEWGIAASFEGNASGTRHEEPALYPEARTYRAYREAG